MGKEHTSGFPMSEVNSTAVLMGAVIAEVTFI